MVNVQEKDIKLVESVPMNFVEFNELLLLGYMEGDSISVSNAHILANLL
jgi:hypothetical protein